MDNPLEMTAIGDSVFNGVRSLTIDPLLAHLERTRAGWRELFKFRRYSRLSSQRCCGMREMASIVPDFVRI